MPRNKIRTAPEAVQLLLNTPARRVRVGTEPNRGTYLYKVNPVAAAFGSKEERVARETAVNHATYNMFVKANQVQREVDYFKLLFTPSNLPVLLNHVTKAKSEPRETITQSIERPGRNLVDQSLSASGAYGKDYAGKAINPEQEYLIDHVTYSFPERNEALSQALEQVRQVPINGQVANRGRQGWIVNPAVALDGISMPKGGTATYSKLVMHETERTRADFPKKFERYSIMATGPESLNGHTLAPSSWAAPTQTKEQYNLGLVSYKKVIHSRDGATVKDEPVEFSLGAVASEPDNLIAELSDGKKVIYARIRIATVQPYAVNRKDGLGRNHRNVVVPSEGEVRGPSDWHRIVLNKKNRPIGGWHTCPNPYIWTQNEKRAAKKVTFNQETTTITPDANEPPRREVPKAVKQAQTEPVKDEVVRSIHNYGLPPLERLKGIYEDGIDATFGISYDSCERMYTKRFSEEALTEEFASKFNVAELSLEQRMIYQKQFREKINAYLTFMEAVFENTNPSIFFGDKSGNAINAKYASRLSRYDAVSHMEAASIKVESAKRVMQGSPSGAAGLGAAFTALTNLFYDARGAGRFTFRDQMIAHYKMVDNIYIDLKTYGTNGPLDLQVQREVVRANLGQSVFAAYRTEGAGEGAAIGRVINQNEQTIKDIARLERDVAALRKTMQETLHDTYFTTDSNTMYAQPAEYTKVMMLNGIPRPEEQPEKPAKKVVRFSVMATPASYLATGHSELAQAQKQQLAGVKQPTPPIVEDEFEIEDDSRVTKQAQHIVAATHEVANELTELVSVVEGKPTASRDRQHIEVLVGSVVGLSTIEPTVKAQAPSVPLPPPPPPPPIISEIAAAPSGKAEKPAFDLRQLNPNALLEGKGRLKKITPVVRVAPQASTPTAAKGATQAGASLNDALRDAFKLRFAKAKPKTTESMKSQNPFE